MRDVSRRAVLRGAGVALGLPFLESLTPQGARAQTFASPRRFIAVFFPMGTAQPWWTPSATGSGNEWALSAILEPFTNLKAKSIVLSGLENYSTCGTNPTDQGYSHARRPGVFLTSANLVQLQEQHNQQEVNGISVDQVIAQHESYRGQTSLESLSLSLGTAENSCDGLPCCYSRNVSWRGMSEPNWPLLDPGEAFDRIMGTGVDSADIQQRRALDQSVLDYVIESAGTLAPRLGRADQAKVDEFLSSVRDVEQRVIQSSLACGSISRPTMRVETRSIGEPPLRFAIGSNTADYDKGTHADLMNDLMVLALQCDATRVITHMMENERSEFIYSHVSLRAFTETTSTETGMPCGNYHGASAGYQEEFATITRWQALKTAELCQRLNEIDDVNGATLLDNTVLMLASCMDGVRHIGVDLPCILVGGLGGVLKTNQHIALSERPMRDLYFTLMNQGFNLGLTDFGNSALGAPIATLEEILA
jgi:hypothetical protein